MLSVIIVTQAFPGLYDYHATQTAIDIESKRQPIWPYSRCLVSITSRLLGSCFSSDCIHVNQKMKHLSHLFASLEGCKKREQGHLYHSIHPMSISCTWMSKSSASRFLVWQSLIRASVCLRGHRGHFNTSHTFSVLRLARVSVGLQQVVH